MSRLVCCDAAPRAGAARRPWRLATRGPRPPCARGRRSRRPARGPPSGARGTRRAAPRPPSSSARRSRWTPRSPSGGGRAPRRSRGKASFQRIQSVMPNASSVQIISPTLGVTRKLPLPSLGCDDAAQRCSAMREEERDQAEDEGVEHDRLGQGEAEPLDRGDLVAHLGLAGHRLDDLAEDEADADAGSDGAETGTHAECDGLHASLGGRPSYRRLGEDRDRLRGEVHLMCAPLVSAPRRRRRRGRSP